MITMKGKKNPTPESVYSVLETNNGQRLEKRTCKSTTKIRFCEPRSLNFQSFAGD